MNALTQVHVGSGILSVVVVLVPLVSRKGQRAHRVTGWIFSIAMGVVALTALPLAVLMLATSPSGALFFVQLSWLGGASVVLGLRALRTRSVVGAWRIERAAAIALTVFSTGFIVVSFARGSGVFSAFGLLGALQGWQWQRFFAAPDRETNGWLLMHLNGMGTAAISAITAAVVTNARLLGLPANLSWLAWIAPGLLGGLGLGLWQRHYRLRASAVPAANRPSRASPPSSGPRKTSSSTRGFGS